MRKRDDWERVWEQREEDRTGQRLDIKVPPKYISAAEARVPLLVVILHFVSTKPWRTSVGFVVVPSDSCLQAQ